MCSEHDLTTSSAQNHAISAGVEFKKVVQRWQTVVGQNSEEYIVDESFLSDVYLMCLINLRKIAIELCTNPTHVSFVLYGSVSFLFSVSSRL